MRFCYSFVTRNKKQCCNFEPRKAENPPSDNKYKQKKIYMARPRKTAKLKEPVRIRERKLKNGNISLYLDIYQNGVRKYENLNLYLVPGNDPITKDQNRHAMQVAQKVKSERILNIQNQGIHQWDKIKQSSMTLIAWLKTYEQGSGNFSPSTLKGRKEMRHKIEEYLEEMAERTSP